VGLGFLIVEVSKSHSDAPHPVGLLWTCDWPLTENSTRQHTTLTRGRHPYPRRDLNPQFQKAGGHRQTPPAARPMGSASSFNTVQNKKLIILWTEMRNIHLVTVCLANSKHLCSTLLHNGLRRYSTYELRVFNNSSASHEIFVCILCSSSVPLCGAAAILLLF